jgi:transposase
MKQAKELVTDELWETIEPLLTPEPPKPQGGRPRIDDRAALTGIVFVLKSGIPWEMLGMRIRHDLLATLEGMARGRGVGEAAPSSSRPSWGGRPNRVGACLTRFCFHPCQKGGSRTAANPTDKGKKGTKRHLVSDRRGVPLAVVLTAANVHDSMVFEELIDAVEPIKRPRGRPRRRPEKAHADKAYDDKKRKGALRRRGIKSRIARKGIESSEKLGRHRWVVERTLAWLSK